MTRAQRTRLGNSLGNVNANLAAARDEVRGLLRRRRAPERRYLEILMITLGATMDSVSMILDRLDAQDGGSVF